VTDQTSTAAEPLDLDAIRARLAAATPGPWTAHPDGLVWSDLPGDPVSGSVEQANAELIAHARQDIPALLAEVERLRAQLDKPCGSCHPCTQYADETWRAAGRTPPHVAEWDDTRADLSAARARLARVAEIVQPHLEPRALTPIDMTVLANEVHEAAVGQEAGR